MYENYIVSIQDVMSVNKTVCFNEWKGKWIVFSLWKDFSLKGFREKYFNSVVLERCLKRNCKCTNPGTQDQIRSQCILFSEHLLLTFYDVSRFNGFNLYGNLDHGFDTQYTVKSMHLFPHRSHCRLSMIVRECTAPYRIDRRLSMVRFRDWIQHLFSHTRQTP